MLHDLLESKPVVSDVVVWTIHQVFKRIANMAGNSLAMFYLQCPSMPSEQVQRMNLNRSLP
jgi:hypothetical protein